ncbi:MAG: hypothetical protein R3F17_03380 [Planctomycetota bacterium]
MTQSPAQRRPLLAYGAILLAVAWLATGALFKLYKGSLNDLPPVVLERSPFGTYDTFRGAIAVELCIAALALIWPRVGWVLLAAIYAVFLGILGLLIQSGAESCGCLGSSVTLKPWMMATIDGTLLALLLASKPWKNFGKTKAPALRLVALVPIFLLAFWMPWTKFITPKDKPVDTTTFGGDPPPPSQDIQFAELQPSTWEGQLIYDLDLFQWAENPGVANELPIPSHVVLYRKSCEHCRDHLAQLANEDDGSRQFVLIRIPEIDDENVPDAIELKPGSALEMQLRPLERGYMVHTPTSFDIDEGMMVSGVTELEH